MRILLLSDINSAHTQKWAAGLAKSGCTVAIFSISKPVNDWYTPYGISLISSLGYKVSSGAFSRLRYLKLVPSLKKAIKNFKPDIVHAHYATSYGLLGSLSRFKPYIISVWGSDVFDFPKKSFLHKAILKYNLKKANKVLSTSHAMAAETQQYTTKKIEVTPFGIDTAVFKPMPVKSLFNAGDIVIGTIKSLEKKYGISVLMKAFAQVRTKHRGLPLKLMIAGDGTQKQELLELSRSLSIDDCTVFTGKINQQDVPAYHNMLHVYVSLSILDSESFGVAVLEAAACEKPVIVSDVSGFKEVVENNVNGIIVKRNNVEEASAAMEFFITNKDKAELYGKNGRLRVNKLYNWEDNLQQMVDIYKSTFART